MISLRAPSAHLGALTLLLTLTQAAPTRAGVADAGAALDSGAGTATDAAPTSNQDAGPDTDGDGFADSLECPAGSCPDTDGDGISDELDEDDDGDGVPSADERIPGVENDIDDDGIPNHLDDDDDGDGLATAAERPGGQDVDSDGDGVPDYLDDDDDGDGLFTGFERPDAMDVDTDGDGTPDHLDDDDDDDGVPTASEHDEGRFQDRDDEGTPDHLDEDDDGDGVLTADERPDGEDRDTDDDGIPDYLDEDDDNDGLETVLERPEGADVDTDGDGAPDHLDADDDNDGIPTSAEGALFGEDSDADGIPDYLDEDDDNDGIPTFDERPNGQNTDINRNGRPDHLDPAPSVPPDAGSPDEPPQPGDAGAMAPPSEPAQDEDGGNPMQGPEEDVDAARPRFPIPVERDAGPLAPEQEPDTRGRLLGGGCRCNVGGEQRGASTSWLLLALVGVYLARRRSLRRLAAGVLCLGAVLAAQPARAQERDPGIALNRFEPAGAGSQWLVGESVDWGGHLRFSLRGLWDASFKPLTAVDPQNDELTSVVESQIFTHGSGNVTLFERLRLGANVPLMWFQTGTSTVINDVSYEVSEGLALGDIRLDADALLLGETGDPLRVGVGSFAFLPTGSTDSFTSDGSLRLMPRAMVAGDVGSFTYSAQSGAQWRLRSGEFAGVPFGWEWRFAAAAGVRVWSDRIILGSEFWGGTVLSGDAAFTGPATPIEGALTGHYTEGPWSFGAALSSGVTPGIGAPQLRAVLSLSWVQEIVAPVEAPKDSDGDGILDRDDACPDQLGRSNIDPIKNGCPGP